ncbi:PLEKHH2 [Cordylochernes scorpioides]|uniref:PLEKHH2 n=1 Tax=Cordylochernes scorpioides TaxID=51811 RepID=A0ABY6LVE6_9ARAC|nr:PLEKHH2 [Cordylochernes scorpioides]
MLEMTRTDPEWKDKIITGDETWVYMGMTLKPSVNLPSGEVRSNWRCVQEATLEKCGYLTKLGGKFKTWRRRWFVLREGALLYYKSQHDMYRKPQGRIVLDETCRISRSEGASFEEKVSDNIKCPEVHTVWIVVQNVLKRKATWLLLSRNDLKPAISGWLTKVPLGQINMRDARVQEVAHMSDSDQDCTDDEPPPSDFTLAIFPRRQGPTYLLCGTLQEMEAWLYHLTVVSSGETLGGSQYEQLVARLMEADGNEGKSIDSKIFGLKTSKEFEEFIQKSLAGLQ